MKMKHVMNGICEHRLMRLKSAESSSFGVDGAYLEPLGGFQRTKESTLGAVGNVLGGAGQVITGSGGRFRGAIRIGEGLFDIADIPVSLVADGIRTAAGTPSNPHNPSGFHISRALRHTTDIRTDDPVNAIKDTVAVVADNIHAIGFKSGSDILRAFRHGLN